MTPGDRELGARLHLLRRNGFLPLGVPGIGAIVDQALLRLDGDIATLLVLPEYGDATMLRTQHASDPHQPGWLVRSVLLNRSAPPLHAARQLLELYAINDQAVS